ncbi:hypothetical protein TNCV_4355121 [Trichonephila clavipes]|nr:hypothetical protein TNCV_4355121 [Trichonephila clavipes]
MHSLYKIIQLKQEKNINFIRKTDSTYETRDFNAEFSNSSETNNGEYKNKQMYTNHIFLRQIFDSTQTTHHQIQKDAITQIEKNMSSADKKLPSLSTEENNHNINHGNLTEL